MLKKTWSILG